MPKELRPYPEMKDVADEIVERLRSRCLPFSPGASPQIEIAGSVRRLRPMVSDLDIVCVPLPTAPAFGKPYAVNAVYDYLREQADSADCKTWQYRMRDDGKARAGFGPQNMYMLFHGIPVDIFVVDEAVWGMGMFVHTGPAAWNRIAMSQFHQWGMKAHVSSGGIETPDGARHPVPERPGVFRTMSGSGVWMPIDELQVFRLLQWPETEPPERTKERARQYFTSNPLMAVKNA